MMFEILYPVLNMFYPFYSKEKLNYESELEQNKIEFKKLKRNLKEKFSLAIETSKEKTSKNLIDLKDKKVISEVKKQGDLQLKKIKKERKDTIRELKKRYSESKGEAKINFMLAVAKYKETRQNVKLTKKSKSNLHQILYEYAKLPYDKKKNSLVVLEISPSREIKFGIKSRVFKDLNAFNDKTDDRVYASEKDIIFTNIKLENGNEKVPIVIRYSGQCTALFLEDLRDKQTMEKFSTENEHHIMLLSERLRETKAPRNKFNFKFGKTGTMIGIMIILMIFYAGYKYFKGGI
jgi:hypothetical protein